MDEALIKKSAPGQIDLSQAIPLEKVAGQFFLFSLDSIEGGYRRNKDWSR